VAASHIRGKERSYVSPCGIYGGKSGVVTGFPPSTSVIVFQYHYTKVLYSHVLHLSPTVVA